MRSAIIAAAAVIMTGAPALAQTPDSTETPAATAAAADPGPTCSGFAPTPTLPDGATATQAQMTEGEQLYQGWGQPLLAKLQQCRDEIYALRAQLQAREQAFNATNATLRAVTDAWQADVTEFNARTPPRRRSSR